jgi:hypothetical protein
MDKTIKITRSRSGLPCVGVGGGAFTNTTNGRLVMRDGFVASAIFVKKSGHLACSLEQAIVPIKEGDEIIEVDGHLPIDDNNPDIRVVVFTVQKIRENEADLKFKEERAISRLPEIVVKGLSIYHNRDGSYFAIPPHVHAK